MPEMNGLSVQEKLTEMNCSHAVILLTGVGDLPEAVAAMRAGALEFLRKPVRRAALLDALDRAEVRLAELERLTAIEQLSKGEQEVLVALAEGNSSKKIANKLGISIRTVETHRGSLVRKLGVSNTSAALILAQQSGLFNLAA
jgi:two-component system response regulator FixJ